jgi:hypothetical protein
MWARVVVTVVVLAAVALAARFVPLPGVAAEKLGQPLALFSLDIRPYITATLLVELGAAIVPRFRRLRVDGQDGRAKLRRAALSLTLPIAIFHANTIVNFLREAGAFGWSRSAPIVAIVLLAGAVFVCVAAAWTIDRRGLGGGVIGVSLALAAGPIARAVDASRERIALLSPSVAEWALAIFAFVALVVAFVVVGTRPSAAPEIPAVAGTLTGALLPAAFAAALFLVGSPATMALAGWFGEPVRSLVLGVAATLALAWLLHRPARVGRTIEAWTRKAPDRPALDRAFILACVSSVAIVLAVRASATLVARLVQFDHLALTIVTATAWLVDAAARARAGRDEVVVWTDPRPHVASAIAAALADAGFVPAVRGRAVGEIGQIFAPFAPCEVVVDRPMAEEAKRFLEERKAEAFAFLDGARAPETAEALDYRREKPRPTIAPVFASRRVVVACGIGVALVIPGLAWTGPLRTANDDKPVARATLELVAIDPEDDPFAELADETLPKGASKRSEAVPMGLGDHGLGARIKQSNFILFVPVAGESEADLRRRIEPWLREVAAAHGVRILLGRLMDYGDDGIAKPAGFRTYVAARPVCLTEKDIAEAEPQVDTDRPGGGAYVRVALYPEGAERFRLETIAWMKRRIAVVVDGFVESAPVVQSEISSGRLSITVGSRDRDEMVREAKRLARALVP